MSMKHEVAIARLERRLGDVERALAVLLPSRPGAKGPFKALHKHFGQYVVVDADDVPVPGHAEMKKADAHRVVAELNA